MLFKHFLFDFCVPPFAGKSDGKEAVDLSDAVNTEVKGTELSVEEKREDDDEEPAVAPIESSLS
jgi:hypothetical protein